MGHRFCRIVGTVPGSHWLWVVCPQPGQSWLHGVTRPTGWRAAQGCGGKEVHQAPGDPPGWRDRTVGFPQESFCRAIFAEARDFTDAGETQLLPRTCVFWRRGSGLEEAPFSLPGQRMGGSGKVQLCGPELAQAHTSTHQRSWSREGITSPCPWSLLSQFDLSPAQHGSWPDTNVLPWGKPAWAASRARSHKEGRQAETEAAQPLGLL